jgi:hypothetical protein
VVTQKDLDLKSLQGENSLFVLQMAEGSLAAGGRGGGFGERRVVRVSMFHYKDGVCEKQFESYDDSKVQQFEVPYHVARMPLTLLDGTETMGYGVVDPELVEQFVARTKQVSSP